MIKKNRVLENIFDYTREENPLFENDSQVLGEEVVHQGSDRPNENFSNDNGESFNSCFPDGTVGGGGDVLPKGSIVLDYLLIFTGDIDESNRRPVGICKKTGDVFYAQRANGTLSLYKTDKNRKIIGDDIITVKAISGSSGAGCIPNSHYKENRTMNYYAGKLEKADAFNDGVLTNGGYEKKHAWKISIYENFNNRGNFRIHPTIYDQYSGKINDNEGCISPYIVEESVMFFDNISTILTRSNYVIPLNVDIMGNNNVTRDIIIDVRKKNEDGDWYTDSIPDPKYFESGK